MNDQSNFRFGTAAFANSQMLAKAGLYGANNGLYIGNDMHGRGCYSNQMSAILLCGGARSGKGNFIIPWLVDGHYEDHIVSMDWKGQNSCISQLQVEQNRRVINFSPRKDRGVVSHRINPISYIRGDSPTLIPDAKLFTASFLPLTGSMSGEFFEATGQRYNEAVIVTKARISGEATLPEIADLMAGIGSLSDEWLAFEEHMANQPEESIRQVVRELDEARTSDNPNAGGMAGIKGEIAKAYSCMSDPQIREAVSPPFDFCMSELVVPDAPPHLVNIMEAQEFALTSGPVIKSLYTSALIYKRRNLGSRQQVWNLDEVPNVGSWPLAVGLATYGAGYGIRPIFVSQSMAQLDNIAPNASKIIPNSCGTQIFMGVRGHEDARLVSQSLGRQTLEVDDFHVNEQAKQINEQAMMDVLFNGADPIQAGFQIEQQSRKLQHQTKIPRDLLTPDEVRHMPEETAIVFMPGVLEQPFRATHKPYWQRRDLAGKYLGDPFHSPEGKVEVRGWFGQSFKRIITEQVPAKYADWPQYRSSGQWSYVQGYRPK